MPIFKIVETRPTTQYWYWTVEAADEEEALHKVLDGELEPDEYYTEEDSDAESNYDVEEKTGQDL